MLIFELFNKPVEIAYTKFQPNDVIATFKVGDVNYMCQAMEYGDERGVFNIAFEGDGEFGITGTGNAPVVFATVISFLTKVLQQCDVEGLKFSINQDDPSRLKLYKRMVSKLLPNWTMHITHDEYDSFFNVTNPKTIK